MINNIYVCVCVCVCIYIYVESERERGREIIYMEKSWPQASDITRKHDEPVQGKDSPTGPKERERASLSACMCGKHNRQ